MKDLAFIIVVFLATAAIVGHLEVNFSPFSIRLPMWHRVICMILVVAAYLVWNIGERNDAYQKGFVDGINALVEQIKKEK